MSEILAELFSSKVRAAVLERMLPRPQVGYSLTDLSRILDLPISSLQHECYKLERIGVLEARREGNARRYRSRVNDPIVIRLTDLVITAIGERAALAATLVDVPGLEAAFLGAAVPFEQGAEVVPVVLIGDIGLEEVDAVQQRVARILHVAPAAVEVVFYSRDEWRSRVAEHSSYVAALLAGPRTDLIGDLSA